MGTKICKFCRIINENDKNKILYEDELIVMFNDKSPDAKVHIQTVPKTHIKNIKVLTKSHLELLIHMKDKANQFLMSNYPKEDPSKFQ
jgi:histidine triad (HIT) family protein